MHGCKLGKGAAILAYLLVSLKGEDAEARDDSHESHGPRAWNSVVRSVDQSR